MSIFIVIWLACIAICMMIASRKNNSVLGAFFLGALLGMIGIIIVIAAEPGLPAAPHGMRAVKCTRCNAVQNVHPGQPRFECWQCNTVIPLLSPSRSPQAIAPQPPKPKPAAAKTAAVKPKSATPAVPKPPPGVLARGAPVKVLAVGDEHEGRVGTVQTFFDDADDGLDVGVIFKGDTDIYAFARTELRVVTATGKPAQPRAT
jgi:hypothetical protein